MSISGVKAVENGYILDHKESSIKQASYDITVKEIIIPGDNDHNNVIKPQQMFTIISNETIRLPDHGIMAHVQPKTSLCRDGILILNTGIIDPNYTGQVSTTAINFGSKPYPITKDSVFARVTFQKLEDDGKVRQVKVCISHDRYRADRYAETQKFPAIFLNINGNVEEISNKVLSDSGATVTNKLISQLTVLTVILTLASFVAPILFSGLTKLLPDDYYIEKKRIEFSEKLNKLEEENGRLQKRVIELEALTKSSKTSIKK